MSYNIRINLRYILGNILLIQLYFLKYNSFFKFEREISYFYDFFYFHNCYVHMKICLFENMLILEIITFTKE